MAQDPDSDVVIVSECVSRARQHGREILSEPEAKQILSARGISVPRRVTIADESGVAAAGALAPPLVVKLISPQVVHKSDFGGVAIGLSDSVAVRDAIRRMSALADSTGATVDGYLVEEMAPRGHELMVGGVRDPEFGWVVMLGLGGVFVEILHDVSFRICPIDEAEASGMIDELRAVTVLNGARGGPAASRAAIIDVLLRVGGSGGLLLDLADDLSEVDLNPVIVSGSGAVAVDARFVLAPPAPPHTHMENRPGPVDFSRLFAPKTIAVVGASAGKVAPANRFIGYLRDFGYEGDIYPIHPTAASIDGLPAYPALGSTPQPVDYAYIALPAERVPGVLARADNRVGFAQVLSSGFGEVAEGQDLERKLVEAARAAGVRVIGPNCLGTYSPRGRLTLVDRTSPDVGPVGIISQSGGLSVDILRLGRRRGLRFSGLVSIGNGADITANDLLQFYLTDPQTAVVGVYLESVGDGRRFFELLQSGGGAKPVVLLKGGRTEQGQRAATSHTGALAGDDRIWAALARQTGCQLVDSLEDFIDVLLAFQYLRARPQQPTRDVVLFGNGGGTSVLATDALARAGLAVPAFAGPTMDKLAALGLPPGTSVGNPIDANAWALAVDDGKVAGSILEIVVGAARVDAVVMHLNVGVIVTNTDADVDVLGNLIDALAATSLGVGLRTHHLLVLRSDGDPDIEARKQRYRDRALQAGIPVYDELTNAATALASIAKYEQFGGRHG